MIDLVLFLLSFCGVLWAVCVLHLFARHRRGWTTRQAVQRSVGTARF